MSENSLDIEYVRQAFAGLETGTEPGPANAANTTGAADINEAGGPPWLFFDNAGGAFVLRRVIERISNYLATTPVQIGGSYPHSLLAAERQRAATAELAGWINAPHAEEAIVGPSATALTWRLACSFGETLRPGDEIIITSMDHEANRSPWLRLAKRGVEIRTWQVSENGKLDLTELESLLGDRTRLVCLSHCSNVLGHIEPVRRIADRVHAHGAKLFVDGVAYAPHRQLDMQALDADFYVFSLYKTFGPHAGLLWGKREALLELPGMNHEYLDADALPYKFQPGGANYELTWGSAGIPEYIAELDRHMEGNGSGKTAWQAIAQHEAMLAKKLLDYLVKGENFDVLGPASAAVETRLPIISFRVRGMQSREVVRHLETHHIAARHGHFHARRLLEQFGIDPDDGVVRISFAHYNSCEDVERLLLALDALPN